MNIALVGSGTGGHIYPVVNLALFCRQQDEVKIKSLIWLGVNNSSEEKVAKQHKIEFVGLPGVEYVNYKKLSIIQKFIFQVKKYSFTFLGFFYAMKVLKKHKISFCFSKGGSISIAIILACKCLKIPLLAHESDASYSKSSLLVQKLGYKVIKGFPYSQMLPLDFSSIVKYPKSNLISQKHKEKITILVTGGSKCTKELCEVLLCLFCTHPTLAKKFHWLVCKGWNNELIYQKLAGYDNVEIYNNLTQREIAVIYQNTDFIMCRAGAQTLAESHFFSLKKIIFPLLSSARNHQYDNALRYHTKHGDIIIDRTQKHRLENFVKHLKNCSNIFHGPTAINNDSQSTHSCYSIYEDILTYAYVSTKYGKTKNNGKRLVGLSIQKILALLLLIFILPLAVLLALIISLYDKRTPLFIQTRLGKDKKLFRLYKLRTMNQNVVTPIGRIVRKTGLDEIPQLRNVLKGDMDFIGPRALTQKDVQRLGWDTPKHNKRWSIKPGITGFAQFVPFCDKTLTRTYETYYVRKQGLPLHLYILFLSGLAICVGRKRVKKLFSKYNQNLVGELL